LLQSNLPTLCIGAIRTGPRSPGRSIKRIQTNEGVTPPSHEVGVDARCELDSRADTTCAGINCRPLYYTGQHCEAYGFHNDLSPIKNVPIATVATAWSNQHTGESFILIIHEALYFGSSLDHSLVNPNQLRAHGLIVHDNPYEPDPERSMGIMITDHKKLPFRSDGSTIYFTTWFPSEEELDTFQHVILMSDLPWDPQALIMPYGDHAEQGSMLGDVEASVRHQVPRGRSQNRRINNTLERTLSQRCWQWVCLNSHAHS
jgi:hypothetical protein